jgi:hypothetical protein
MQTHPAGALQSGEQHTTGGQGFSVRHLSFTEGTRHFVRRTHGGGGHSYLQTGSGFMRQESLIFFLHSGITGTTGVQVTQVTQVDVDG